MKCDLCSEMGIKEDCLECEFGNPCLGCTDYDRTTHTCISNGGCGAKMVEPQESEDKE